MMKEVDLMVSGVVREGEGEGVVALMLSIEV